jgi:hypothetical protein
MNRIKAAGHAIADLIISAILILYYFTIQIWDTVIMGRNEGDI